MFSSLLSKDGFIVFAITILSYYIAISYENGYASYFNYSSYFIKIDIQILANVFLGIALIIIMAFLFSTTKMLDNLASIIGVTISAFLFGITSGILQVKFYFLTLLVLFLFIYPAKSIMSKSGKVYKIITSDKPNTKIILFLFL